MDEKPNKYIHLPIPTYEEAISSRPGSSQSRIGPEETSDDAERQGLLRDSERHSDRPRNTNYAPPTVESERSSFDSLDGLGAEHEDGEVRREMQEMDFDDSTGAAHRSLLTSRFKRFTSLTSSFSSLPSFRKFVPSIRLPSIPWPKIDWTSVNANRIVIFGRLFGILLIMGIVYMLIASDMLTMGRGRAGGGTMYDPESVRAFVQGGWRDPTHIGRHLKHLTKYAHIAGTKGSYVLGEYMAEIFKESELEDVSMERFDVYLNYPRQDGRRVAIVEPANQKWEAKIEEDEEQSLVFHGHSKAGDVTGPLIYANYGSRDDFKKLNHLGISVTGAVVLVRYGGTEGDRALKVKAAELAGAVGCIIYSDPAQEGTEHGLGNLPGRLLPYDGVQRGAVSLMSWVLGDVLSPGWASTPSDKHRLRPDESAGLVKIPSIPLSWRDAEHLLGSLKGYGKKMDGDWTGNPSTEYWTGDSNSPKVNLKNEQDEEVYQPIYNVIGRITGWEQSEKKVIVGNHRDAWCVGGADPGSGTAIMLHMIRVFGDLRRQGWRPLRTIEFASWDGEEYNMIGSTEHVENREEELRRNGIVYLNVDTGVTGMDLNAESSPILNTALHRALNRIDDPASNKTLREIWDESGKKTGVLGSGSDFIAFQDIVGTSSIDFHFDGKYFPYHSCYDNYDWMERYGDPSWEYSAALGQLWSLLVLEFADTPLLPFDMNAYATSIDTYINDLESDTSKHLSGISVGADIMNRPGGGELDFTPLRNAVKSIKARIHDIEAFDNNWMSLIYSSGGYESSIVTLERIDRNNKISKFETNLLDLSEGGGLVNRTQFKHVLFAPQTWSGYEGETFPSIRQWIAIEDWDKTQEAIHHVAGILENAAQELQVI